MKITEKSFGKLVKLYTLENDQGVQLSVTDFGARIVRLQVPVDGHYRDLVLGFNTVEEYLEKDHFMGATIGRVAGRIAAGKFNINGENYQVDLNENGNTLHGGSDSFETKIWESKKNVTDELATVTFTYTSPANENGFPGNLNVAVTYSLDNANGWSVDYKAYSDVSTVFNPTNHVYFNLDGDPAKSVANHDLQVEADYYAPLDKNKLTIGKKQSVEYSTFDFRHSKKIAEVFEGDNTQNRMVDGLDHPFLLNKNNSQKIDARLVSSDGRVAIDLTTSSPAIVVFTANFGADFNVPMRHSTFNNHGGITLETQVTPGAERYPKFGSIILNKDERYHEHTLFSLEF